jgi:AraC-like DNA-binding protein
MHSHHAIQLTLAIGGEVRVRTSPRGQWRSAAGVLVDTDLPHAIDCRGGEVVFVFVDPESALGLYLQGILGSQLKVLSEQEAKDWYTSIHLASANEPDNFQTRLRLSNSFIGNPKRLHPGVERVLRYLRQAGPNGDVTLDTLSDVAELSRTRLVHVFTQSVGVPIRPYILWLRVQRAAVALGKGTSVTMAAQEAGFSDSAHLTRTFRRMFGTTPSSLLRSHFQQDA